MDITYQYPPELFQLLIEVIPRLCPRKKDVVLFFRGAGVDASITEDVEMSLQDRSKAPSKFEITRALLKGLNERGERSLRERRELLKRTVEFEDFSTCWPDDQLKAKGL